MHPDICVCMVCILIPRCMFLSWNVRLVSPFTLGPHIPRGMLTSHIRHLLACCRAGERQDACAMLSALRHAVHTDKSMLYLTRSTGRWFLMICLSGLCDIKTPQQGELFNMNTGTFKSVSVCMVEMIKGKLKKCKKCVMFLDKLAWWYGVNKCRCSMVFFEDLGVTCKCQR